MHDIGYANVILFVARNTLFASCITFCHFGMRLNVTISEKWEEKLFNAKKLNNRDVLANQLQMLNKNSEPA